MSRRWRRKAPSAACSGRILVRRGLITMDQLGEALAEQFGVPFVEVVPQAVNPQVVRLLPERLARQRSCVPMSVSGSTMQLAMVAPDDIETISEAELITGYHVEPVVALEAPVQATLDRGFDERIVARQTIVDMKMADLEAAEDAVEEELATDAPEEQEQAPVVRLVRAILMGAINANTSDIHLEPHVPEMRVRYRVDGELQPVMTIPNHIEEAVVARIKVMADMDTTENRRPQDGHLSVQEAGTKVNFRVSTIPTVGGEKVVMRLLDEGSKTFELQHLGMCERDLKTIQTLIDQPHGMIVVTGPTGSGKSTTMYALLSKLNSVSRNIVTVEDPVEYRLPGINQVASDNEHGLGFANALKYIMRQDPDVIMVGEIRDHETAVHRRAGRPHRPLADQHAARQRRDRRGRAARRPGRRQLQDRRRTAWVRSPSGCCGRSAASARSRSSRTSRCCKTLCKDASRARRRGVLPRPRLQEMRRHRLLGPHSDLRNHGRHAGDGRRHRKRLAGTQSCDKSPLSEGMVELAAAGMEQVLAGRTTLEEVFYKLSS